MFRYKVYKTDDGKDILISDLTSWRNGCKALRNTNGKIMKAKTQPLQIKPNISQRNHNVLNETTTLATQNIGSTNNFDLTTIIANAVKSALASSK